MTLLEELAWRGLVQQTTHPELAKLLEHEPFTLYAGFDPTADSLHVGHMLPIIGLMHYQRRGHRPIAVVGGATGMIGDPSGKAAERTLLGVDAIQHNVDCIRQQLGRFLDFSAKDGAVLVNNYDWFGTMSLIEFLRDVGKHFSVNVMMTRESVRARLQDRDQGISYTEFTYQILQAYDFLHLYDNYNCRLQIGGSDQWGNIVAGMDLTRRWREGAQTFGMTMPLVTKADGSKFGKSEEGNIWLDANRTSPYKFYQFWFNQSDADAPRYLRFFTFLSEEEIAELEKETAQNPHQRAAQKKLGEEITRMVHGEDALQNALKASQAMFGGDVRGLDDATLQDIFSEVPSSEVPRAELSAGKRLLDALVEHGVFASKGEARRLIQSGGLYLNNERVPGEDAALTEQALCSDTIAIVRKGKKNYHLLKFVG